jgi:hypothetical protein
MYPNLQGVASFRLTGDRNRAKLRGKIPAISLFSVKLPEIIAHLCAVFPKRKNPSPPHDEWRFNGNKRLSSKKTAHGFGFVSQRAGTLRYTTANLATSGISLCKDVKS